MRGGRRPGGRTDPVARAVLASGGAGVAPVVDGGGRLVGVVTRADLAGPILPNGWQLELDPEAVVSAVMTHHADPATPDEDLAEVVDRMRGRKLRAVPVVDGGRVVGVVPSVDAAHATLVLLHESQGEHSQEDDRHGTAEQPHVDG